jgi:hypothetical protein
MVAGFSVFQGREVFRRVAQRMAERPSLRVRMYLEVRRSQGDTMVASELAWTFVNRFRAVEGLVVRLPVWRYAAVIDPLTGTVRCNTFNAGGRRPHARS